MATVLSVPSPSFTLAPVQANGQQITLTSTTLFPALRPRSEYALLVRVARVDAPDVALAQPVEAAPLTSNSFVVSLPEDGIYQLQLIAFPVRETVVGVGLPVGSVVYSATRKSLVQLQDKNGVLTAVSVTLPELSRGQLPYASAVRVVVQVAQATAHRNQLLAQHLNLRMSGKSRLASQQLETLRKEIQDVELALTGVELQHKAGHDVEAQRHLRLLQKLRADSCC